MYILSGDKIMKVAVIGSTHAGVFAAKSIISEQEGAEVHVFERHDNVSFLSCGIALWVGDQVSDPNRMFYESPESMAEQGIHMHMQTDVQQADLATKTLVIKNLVTGDITTEIFDKIVITTGSKAIVPPLPGIDSDKIYFSKTWQDANELRELTPNLESVVVIGAGYIGAELAEQLSRKGKNVTLIDATDRVMSRTASKEFSATYEEAFQSHGVTLALNEKVIGFEDTDDGIIVKTDRGAYAADMAVLSIGFAPNTDLFAGQVDMLANGAIVTNDYMETSVEGVFAAGDASAVFYTPTQTHEYMPLATNAIRQGMVIGHNVVKPSLTHPGTQGTSAVELYELAFASTGLNKTSAAMKGLEAETAIIEEDYRPDFMLTTEKVKCSLTWDKTTHRIIGAEFMSKHDISQAANVVSVAIENKMTIDQLALSDFFFQPNFAQPLNYVSSVAIKAVLMSRSNS